MKIYSKRHSKSRPVMSAYDSDGKYYEVNKQYHDDRVDTISNPSYISKIQNWAKTIYTDFEKMYNELSKCEVPEGRIWISDIDVYNPFDFEIPDYMYGEFWDWYLEALRDDLSEISPDLTYKTDRNYAMLVWEDRYPYAKMDSYDYLFEATDVPDLIDYVCSNSAGLETISDFNYFNSNTESLNFNDILNNTEHALEVTLENGDTCLDRFYDALDYCNDLCKARFFSRLGKEFSDGLNAINDWFANAQGDFEEFIQDWHENNPD